MNGESNFINGFRIYSPGDDGDFLDLASMNAQLIVDEGHRYRLSESELIERMESWLANGYIAKLIRNESAEIVGYVLWREEPDHLFVRQFFIVEQFRRQGIGSKLFSILREHCWSGWDSIRLDVLDRNSRARTFWESLGFGPYARTLELCTDAQ